MSLGVAIKSGEGIVLAADSRATILATLMRPDGQMLLVPATYDNASKLLRLKGQEYAGAVTFGTAAIGTQQPRTAGSFLPEFEAEITRANAGRLSVEEFAQRLGEFFTRKWTESGDMPPAPDLASNMIFFVGGFNENEPYGRLYQLFVPSVPVPEELQPNTFGAVWGGQTETTDRLVQGFDPRVPELAQNIAGLAPGDRIANFADQLKANLQLPIPWQFLPLQDCVDLSVFLVRTTITLQQWLVSIRGVGGAVDVATITGAEGFKAVEIKQITLQKRY